MTGELYKTVDDGEPVILLDGMALLLGVTAAEIQQSMEEQGAPAVPWVIPPEWVQQGRRIARKAQMASGSTTIQDTIDHLAAQR